MKKVGNVDEVQSVYRRFKWGESIGPRTEHTQARRQMHGGLVGGPFHVRLGLSPPAQTAGAAFHDQVVTVFGRTILEQFHGHGFIFGRGRVVVVWVGCGVQR